MLHRFTLYEGAGAVIAIALAACSTSAVAKAPDEPSASLSAFADLCLKSASNAEIVQRSALIAGWTPQQVRVISTASGTRLHGDALPAFFRKGRLTLTLTKLGGASGAHLCAISSPIDGKLSTQMLTQVVSLKLQSGEPSIVSDGRGERAVWRLGASLQVEAEVRRESSIRTVRLLARSEQQQFALSD